MRSLLNCKPARRSGFTFLELVLVIAIIAILFSVSLMSLKSMGPKYRLRSAAREVGSTIEQVRLMAVSRQEWMGIQYVLQPPPTAEDPEPAPYYQVIAPGEYIDQPLEERPRLSKKELPTGVRIHQVILASNQVIDNGSWDILFSPAGNTGTHIVVLAGQEDRFQSLKFNAITGLIDFYEQADIAFRSFQD